MRVVLHFICAWFLSSSLLAQTDVKKAAISGTWANGPYAVIQKASDQGSATVVVRNDRSDTYLVTSGKKDEKLRLHSSFIDDSKEVGGKYHIQFKPGYQLSNVVIQILINQQEVCLLNKPTFSSLLWDGQRQFYAEEISVFHCNFPAMLFVVRKNIYFNKDLEEITPMYRDIIKVQEASKDKPAIEEFRSKFRMAPDTVAVMGYARKSHLLKNALDFPSLKNALFASGDEALMSSIPSQSEYAKPDLFLVLYTDDHGKGNFDKKIDVIRWSKNVFKK